MAPVRRKKGTVFVFASAPRLLIAAVALWSLACAHRAAAQEPAAEAPPPATAVAPPADAAETSAPAAAPTPGAPESPAPQEPLAPDAPDAAALPAAAPAAPSPAPAAKAPPTRAPAKAELHPSFTDDRVSVGFGAHIAFRRDDGYDLFTEHDAFLAPAVRATVELLRLPRSFALALTLDWHREQARSKGLLGSRFSSAYDANLGRIGVEARYYVQPWLYPHLSLWGGMAATAMRLRNGTPGQISTYREPLQWSAIAGVGAGCSVRTPPVRLGRRRGPSFGVSVEAGYAFGQADTFELRSKGAGPSAIDVQDGSLGSLSRSAPYLLGTAFVRL